MSFGPFTHEHLHHRNTPAPARLKHMSTCTAQPPGLCVYSATKHFVEAWAHILREVCRALAYTIAY